MERRGRESSRKRRTAVDSGNRPRVLALVHSRLDRARISDGLSSRAVLVHARTVRELRELLTAPGAAVAILIETRDAEQTPTAPIVGEIRSKYPGVALIGYVRPDAKYATDIVDLVNAGIHELVFKGVDDTSTSIRNAIDQGSLHLLRREVLQFLNPLVSNKGRRIVETATMYAGPDTSSRDIAKVLGISLKTLIRRCLRADLPQPGALLNWIRLMIATRQLEKGYSVQQVAASMANGSAGAVRNLFKRYLGRRPKEVVAHGGLSIVLAEFEKRSAFGRRFEPEE